MSGEASFPPSSPPSISMHALCALLRNSYFLGLLQCMFPLMALLQFLPPLLLRCRHLLKLLPFCYHC